MHAHTRTHTHTHTQTCGRACSPTAPLLRLQGLPTPPEQSLLFSVPLGGREARIFRFRHLLDEKTDYRVALASATPGGGRDTSSREGASAPPGVATPAAHMAG